MAMTMMGLIIITAVGYVLCAAWRAWFSLQPCKLGIFYSIAQMRKIMFREKVHNSFKITQLVRNQARKWGFHSQWITFTTCQPQFCARALGLVHYQCCSPSAENAGSRGWVLWGLLHLKCQGYWSKKPSPADPTSLGGRVWRHYAAKTAAWRGRQSLMNFKLFPKVGKEFFPKGRKTEGWGLKIMGRRIAGGLGWFPVSVREDHTFTSSFRPKQVLIIIIIF